jgi:hypothetical protein
MELVLIGLLFSSGVISVSKLFIDDGGVIKFIKNYHCHIDERGSNKEHNSLVYAAYLYTNCDDNISKIFFCNSPRGY